MTSPHPRIAVLGIALEASIYSPARSRVVDFVRRDGDAYFAAYPFLSLGEPLREAAEWVPITYYRAIPGGIVPTGDWDEMCDVMLSGLAREIDGNGPVDAVLLDLHGALSAVDVDDAEGELAARVRGLVGPEVLIGGGMDLHGNVSPRLISVVDLLTCYRMAPHEDAQDTRERAARTLLELAQGPAGPRPAKAWVGVPILLPGEKTSTRIEPAKGLYAQVPVIEARAGVIDAAVWIGYAWADEPRNHAAVVVTGPDAAQAVTGAEELATWMWRVRDEFDFVAPSAPLTDCLDAAAVSTARPYFISDSGDNPTAGGAGDVTWTLARLLERDEITSGRVNAIYASIPDAAAADAAEAAGVGAEVTVTIGARVDDVHEGPVTLTATVEHIHNGDEVAQLEVVLRTGGLHVLLTRARKPYHRESDFTRNGLSPRDADLVVVKIGYLEPELYAMAADWMMALTPGGVDQDLDRVPHHRIRRPMFPYDAFETDPPLAAELMPAGNSAAVLSLAAQAEATAAARAGR